MARSVTATGDKAAAERVRAIGARGGDIRGAAAKVRTVVREAQTARFETDGFARWPKLAASTVANKQRMHRDPRPMRSTGALMRALTAARAKGQVDDRRRDALTFGTDLPYAGFHQDGRGVPQRELEEFPAAFDRRIADVMGDYVSTGK